MLSLLASACQVTLTAGVDAHADGTGSVRAGLGLDDDALAQLGDPAKELRLDDLRQSGWTVVGPAKEKDGLTWVRLAKPFSTAEEGSRAAAQLSGPDGPFRDLRLRRTRSLLKTTTSLSGLIDLSHGLSGLSDPGLRQALGDVDPGLAKATDETVHVRFEARLQGERRSWAPKLGEQLRIASRAESWNVRPVLAALLGLVLAGAALVVFVATRR